MDRAKEWHIAFAWVPHKTLSGEVVWLERLQRRFVGYNSDQYEGLMLQPFAWWEFRALAPKLRPDGTPDCQAERRG